MSDSVEGGERTEREGAREVMRPEALKVATGLRIAASVLAVPATAVAMGALIAFVALGLIAGTALADGATILRWVILALALAGVVATVLFLVRVRVTRRAARDEEALAEELLGLVDLEELTTAVLADLADLTSREGGVRAASRARALWRVLRRLDVGEHVSSFERARWFVPPDVGDTWLRAQVVSWGGLAAWVLIPVVGAARAAGWV